MRLLLATVLAAALAGAAPALAAAAPPVNDAYLASLPIDSVEFTATADTTEATTQADIFNPSSSGQPLGGGPAETTTCKGTAFGRTVWYDLAPQADGDVSIRATGFPTVVAVYEWDRESSQIRGMVDCSASAATEDLILSVRRGRNYTVQVGGVGGAGGALALKVDYFPDGDGDGVYDALDRCPTTAGIERFGGCPPELPSRARLSVDYTSTGVRITRLWVERVPKGAKIVASCRGCGSQTVRAQRAGVVTLSRFAGRAVNAGNVIQVKTTMRRTGSGRYRFGATGKYARFEVRAGGFRVLPERCLNVRTAKAERCR